MESQTMTYDTPARLNQNSFEAPEGKRFAGWMRGGVLGGTLRTDEATVINLCDCGKNNQASGYTLQAQWVPKDVVHVVVAKDGSPYSGLQVEMKSTDETIKVKLEENKVTKGFYSIPPSIPPDSSTLPEDEYQIFINDKNTGKTITVGNNEEGKDDKNFAELQYYTVTLSCDDKLNASSLKADGKSSFGESVPAVLEGGEVSISIDEAGTYGYVFDKWVSQECDPEGWDTRTGISGKDTSSQPSARITVTGKTLLKAFSKPITYTVNFDANKPEKALGDMKGEMSSQSLAYGDALTADCGYVLPGYTFLGWSSSPDGECIKSGEAANLAGTEGAEVTVYARWEKGHDFYIVSYDANGGKGVMSEDDFWTDTPYNLSGNCFTREGYDFTGWNTMPDGTGKAYEENEMVKDITEKNRRIVLYAQWKMEEEPVQEANVDEDNIDEKEQKDENSDIGANTGDESNVRCFWLLAAGALLVAALTIAVRKKKA